MGVGAWAHCIQDMLLNGVAISRLLYLLLINVCPLQNSSGWEWFWDKFWERFCGNASGVVLGVVLGGGSGTGSGSGSGSGFGSASALGKGISRFRPARRNYRRNLLVFNEFFDFLLSAKGWVALRRKSGTSDFEVSAGPSKL